MEPSFILREGGGLGVNVKHEEKFGGRRPCRDSLRSNSLEVKRGCEREAVNERL